MARRRRLNAITQKWAVNRVTQAEPNRHYGHKQGRRYRESNNAKRSEANPLRKIIGDEIGEPDT